jgi:hypothetical protein
MNYFLETLKSRNETLYYFGLACLVSAIAFVLLWATTNTKVYGVNAWIKPFKFSVSTFLYVWAMAWFIGYLPAFNASLFNWVTIITLGFEIVYIALQASKGQLSHYNISTPVYASLYAAMAAAATIATIGAAYIGILFFASDFPQLPPYYLWAIRLGIIIFVIFSFEGFVMGSRMTHTIGGPDGESGIPVLNWSTKYGDPRIAHFIGMHALQVIPILSYHLLKSTRLTILLGIAYALLAVFTLVQALQGKPFIKQ